MKKGFKLFLLVAYLLFIHAVLVASFAFNRELNASVRTWEETTWEMTRQRDALHAELEACRAQAE